jgi:hypothetical protein
MRTLRSGLGLAMMAAAMVPAATLAQTIIPLDTYSGGSSFITSVTASLTYATYNDGNPATLDDGYIVFLSITGFDGPGTIASAGIINVPRLAIVTAGPDGNGWGWETTQQLNGAGMPGRIYAWNAPPPDPQTGISVGEAPPTWTFSFLVRNVTEAQVQDLGFGIHAIAYIGCSTKLGVWDGGETINRNGSSEGDCVSVPEPGSLFLLGSGAAGMAFVASRRRKSIELIDEDGNDLAI